MTEDPVLVIDDSALVRRQVREVLTSIGLRTVEVSSGLDALSVLQREPILLVITDVTMPEMSGIELITAMRKQPVSATVPVIVLSTLGKGESVEQGWALGVKAC